MSSSNWLRLRLPNSIAGRLTLWFCGSAFALVLAVAFVLVIAAHATVQWAEDQVLEQRLVDMRQLIAVRDPDPGMVGHEVTEAADGPRQMLIRVVTDARDFALATPGMDRRLPTERFSPPGQGGNPLHETIEHDGQRYRALSARMVLQTPAARHDALVQIAVDTTLDDLALARFMRVLAVVILVAGAASALAGLLIIRRQLAPLHRVIEATAGIKSAAVNERLEINGLPRELAVLGVEFNNMLDRLEGAYSRVQQYADNVAHELRTPVNRMLLNVEVALAKPREPASYRDVLESTRDDTATMAQIVDHLLFLARAENDQIAIAQAPLDLTQEAEKVREFYETLADEKGINLQAHADAGLFITGDSMMLRRALSNLVSNALSHTAPGRMVSISARRDRGEAVIEIADSGDGIDSADLPFIFDRFFRGDRSRPTTERRLGLGLSITKSIVMLHGGQITVSSVRGLGTRFRLAFPSAEPKSLVFPSCSPQEMTGSSAAE